MRDKAFIILLMALALGVAALGVAYISADNQERDTCTEQHQVCVLTTDGWKPYEN